MSFSPHPVNLVVRCTIEQVANSRGKFGKINFRNASTLLRFWPADDYVPGREGKIPIVVMFREDAYHRINETWWSLVDRGPAQGAQGARIPRIAQLNFHGEEFTDKFVKPLFEGKAADRPQDVLESMAGRDKPRKESEQEQSQNLYNAFVRNDSIELYARLGTLPDDCEQSGKIDYNASLIVRLRCSQREFPHL